MTYHPTPINTSGVALGGELAALVERLVENAHEVWARARMDQGWRHGPERDDELKRHPCLVPYGELPHAEREIDRAMVVETLRAALALGYTLTRMPGAP